MEPIDQSAITSSLYALLWMFAVMSMSHLVISAAGILYVEAEILRQGNEELLDSLDEGLMIVEKEKIEDVIFLNKSAKKFEFV